MKRSIDKNAVFEKVIRMFRPHGPGQFLGFDGNQVIHGPNDRAMIGFDTHFPKEWLLEDYGFTPEEADWFIAEVTRQNAETNPVT